MFLIAASMFCLAANPVVLEDDASLDLLEKEGIHVVFEDEEIALDEDLDEIEVQEIVFEEENESENSKQEE